MENIREFHDKLNNIFHLTLALPLVPMGYLFLEIKHRGWIPAFEGNMVIYGICFIASLAMLLISYKRYRSKVLEIRESESTRDKFHQIFPVYRMLYLGNLLVAIVLSLGYFLTGAGVLLGSYLFQLFALSFLRPHADRYIRDLLLSAEESKSVRKKELAFE